MSTTERKNFLQRRTSTAAGRAAYRAKRNAEREAFWNSEQGKAYREQIAKSHADYLASQKKESE